MSSPAYPVSPPQVSDDDTRVNRVRASVGEWAAGLSPGVGLEPAPEVRTPGMSVSYNTEGTALCLHDHRGTVTESVFFSTAISRRGVPDMPDDAESEEDGIEAVAEFVVYEKEMLGHLCSAHDAADAPSRLCPTSDAAMGSHGVLEAASSRGSIGGCIAVITSSF